MFGVGAKIEMRAQSRLHRLWESESEAGQIERFQAKRGAVGALAIGAQGVRLNFVGEIRPLCEFRTYDEDGIL